MLAVVVAKLMAKAAKECHCAQLPRCRASLSTASCMHATCNGCRGNSVMASLMQSHPAGNEVGVQKGT